MQPDNEPEMKLGLPDSYLSPIDLPFNRASLDNHFQISTPDKDPTTNGVWLILQGNLLLTTADKEPALPSGASPPLTGSSPALYIGSWDG